MFSPFSHSKPYQALGSSVAASLVSVLSSLPTRIQTQPVHGSLARFVTHPSDFCYKLPDGMSLEEGAMCEPVSVGVHACRRAGIAASVLR